MKTPHCPSFKITSLLQKEKERRASEEKRIQEGSRLRKQREQLNAELTEVKAQLIKRQSLEEMKALVASYNVIVHPLIRI